MKSLILVLTAAACTNNAADVPVDAPAPIVPPDASTTGVRAIPLEGCGYSYTGQFGLGDVNYRLLVDTGSDLLAVAAEGCTQCTTDGVTDLYTPGATAMDEHVTQQAAYDEGEMTWKGETYLDEVSAGLLPAMSLPLAAITTETHFFNAGQCGDPQGILGLSPVPDTGATATNFLDAIARAGATDELAMHYCLGTGTMWIDGYDHAAAIEDPTWIPMKQQEFYTISVSDFAIAGTSIGLPATTYGNAIVDSGGPNLLPPTAAYNAIVAKLAASPAFAAKFGASWFTTPACVELPDTRAEIDAAMPVLTVNVGSISIDLPATAAYLQSYASSTGTVYCPGLYDGGQLGLGTDLGNTLIRAGIVIFDRPNSRLGFAHAQPCDDQTARAVAIPPLRPFNHRPVAR